MDKTKFQLNEESIKISRDQHVQQICLPQRKTYVSIAHNRRATIAKSKVTFVSFDLTKFKRSVGLRVRSKGRVGEAGKPTPA